MWRAFLVTLVLSSVAAQLTHRVGRLQEAFAWKQLTFNINGRMVLQDRFGSDDLEEESTRERRQTDGVVFNDNEEERNWDGTGSGFLNRPQGDQAWTGSTIGSQHINQPQRDQPWTSNTQSGRRPQSQQWNRPSTTTRPTTSRTTSTTQNSNDEARRFFVQYNNLPMGVERVGNRLFVTLPRRRYGIPSTLNYLDLTLDSHERSPGLRPYPSLRRSATLTSVYRTRADSCGRLWMVDTGMIEIPNNRQQVQQPAVVVFDVTTDRQLFRYPLKDTDITSPLSPTGLASITVDIVNNDCTDAYAYIPELATYGLIVFSLRDSDSWRLSHNYFSFNPTAGNLQIAGQRFQWNDGIFSITLSPPLPNNCRTAYFHAMVGTQEFSVSTCTLRNKTASQASDFWAQFSIVGDRGANSQSTMHGYHSPSGVLFYADIARDAVSCWNSNSLLNPTNVEILAQHSSLLSYPADLHVSGEEVWVLANSLPRWAYSQLDTTQYNFFIYKATVQDLISGTVCGGSSGGSNPPAWGTGLRMGEQNDTIVEQ